MAKCLTVIKIYIIGGRSTVRCCNNNKNEKNPTTVVTPSIKQSKKNLMYDEQNNRDQIKKSKE